MTLSGGTITAAGLSMAANGSLLITGGGMLVLPGNKEALIDGYISSGWLSPCIAEWHRTGPYRGKTTVVAALEVAVDIKPPSCPNPLNVNNQGRLSVAIVGTAELDVTTIDIGSIRLEGVSPVGDHEIEDVTTPAVGGVCDCTEAGPDGIDDLTVRFPTQEIVDALGNFSSGDILVLTLTGELSDDTPIAGADCIRVKKHRAKRPKK